MNLSEHPDLQAPWMLHESSFNLVAFAHNRLWSLRNDAHEGSGRPKSMLEGFLEEVAFLLGFEERDDLILGKIILSVFFFSIL